MGIFSSKKVTTAGVVVAPLTGEKPNLIRTAIQKAIITDTPIVPNIVEGIINGYNINPDRFYNAAKNGNYLFGLPTGISQPVLDRAIEVKQVIADYENIPVDSIKFNTDPITWTNMTDDFIGRIFTQIEFAEFIEPETGINVIQGNDYNGFRNSYVAEYLSTEVIRDSLPAGRISTNATELSANVTFLVYLPADRAGTESEVTISGLRYRDYIDKFGVLDWESRLYGVAYNLPDGIGGFYDEKYWAYDVDSGIYPQLELFGIDSGNSPYFPAVPIRVDKRMVGTEITPIEGEGVFVDLINEILDEAAKQEAIEQALGPLGTVDVYQQPSVVKQIDKMLGHVGTDLENLQESLSTNESIGDIDDVFVTFAVRFGILHDINGIGNTNKPQEVLKYCYKYFEYLMNDIQTYDKAAFEASEAELLPLGRPPIFNYIRIVSAQLKQTLYWNYIEIVDEPWVDLTPNGTFGGFGRIEGTYRMGGYLFDDISPKDDMFYSKSELWFYVYDDDLQTAKKIIIHGLYTENDVISGSSVVNTLWDSYTRDSAEAKDGLYIPISYDVLRTFSSKDQDVITFYGLVLVIYAIRVDTVKFYERAAFWKLVQVAIIIYSFYTLDPTKLALLAPAEVAKLVIKKIILNYLIGQALSLIFTILVDVIGFEAAAILAVIAIAYGASAEMGIIDPINLLPDAALILQASSALANATMLAIQKEGIELQDELKQLEEAGKRQQEQIESFGLSDGLDILSMIEATKVYVESPDAFFRRTINPSGGLSTLDTVNYYYDNALSLDLDYI